MSFFDDLLSKGSKKSEKRSRRYPTVESSDDAIDAFIERKRNEFYEEWWSYANDFE